MHESANAAVPAARRWLGRAGIACLAVLAACACSTAMQQRPLLPDGTHAAADAQDANAARAVIVYFDRSGDVEQTKRRISAAAAGWHAPLLYTLDRVGAIVLGVPTGKTAERLSADVGAIAGVLMAVPDGQQQLQQDASSSPSSVR
ncbi:hypothetical protein NG831_18865 [Xanthomonas sacchari]|uniref:hypothetical protein n=1 Tax=Xanthomonas sacchari TaxID=56458 RepID=UPI00224DF802|nr:hypothetical protein [Xanthomonas sacchari]MCW0413928.1 hypothetical protein [Xanthomonas sacchari]UYK66162.1 hypothetical protein NG831_18865 [Xanthomonas sacchari]